MGNTHKTKPVIAKIIDDVAFCLKNIATDAIADVIEREVEKRKKQKAVVVEEATIIPSTSKRKHRRAIKYNANKNN